MGLYVSDKNSLALLKVVSFYKIGIAMFTKAVMIWLDKPWNRWQKRASGWQSPRANQRLPGNNCSDEQDLTRQQDRDGGFAWGSCWFGWWLCECILAHESVHAYIRLHGWLTLCTFLDQDFFYLLWRSFFFFFFSDGKRQERKPFEWFFFLFAWQQTENKTVLALGRLDKLRPLAVSRINKTKHQSGICSNIY